MGTKGRDIAMWLLIITIPLVVSLLIMGQLILARILLSITLGATVWFLFFQYVTVPTALRTSQIIGLHSVVLVPIDLWWATRIMKRANMLGYCKRAYEIHVLGTSDNIGDFTRNLDDDLKKIAILSLKDTLFIWETPAPIPWKVRKMIRDKVLESKAFWNEGGWEISRPPFISKPLKRGYLRHGALLWEGVNDLWTIEKKG